MSDEDDIVSALGLAEAPTPKAGQTVQKVDPEGDVASLRGKIGRSAAEILGLPDAMKALRGNMTSDEAQHFALTAAMGLIPGAKIENALMRSASSLARPGENALTGMVGKEMDSQLARIGQQNVVPTVSGNPQIDKYKQALTHMDWEDAAKAMPGASFNYTKPVLSDADIDKALAKNPGASIFDVAGTHVGGASSPYSPNPLTNSMLAQKGYGDVDAASIPRVGGVLSTPLAAKVLGRSENLVHGTRVSTDRWMTPEGGGEALALPEDELGVHFGNPRQAQVFTGSGLDNYSSPRTYPVVVQANNPLRMQDLGSWHEDRIIGELARLNRRTPGADGVDLRGQFPQSELGNLDGMPAIRQYLNDKGYDSVVYRNSEEDRGHDSFIKFTPSPVDPQFVSGVRSPWAKFDPNKLSWPELAAGVPMAAGSAGAATGLLFDQNNNPIVQTK